MEMYVVLRPERPIFRSKYGHLMGQMTSSSLFFDTIQHRPYTGADPQSKKVVGEHKEGKYKCIREWAHKRLL